MNLLVDMVVMILAVVTIDGITAYVTGEQNKGNRIISSLITITLLYMVIVGMMGSSSSGFISDGIPFASVIDKKTALVDLMHNDLWTFVKETAELISLCFLISFIERVLPVENSNISVMITSRIILVLAGIICNSMVVSLVYENEIYQWALTILQCLLSGTAIVLPPAAMIGRIVGLDSDNPIVSYILEQLQGSAFGQALSSSVSRAAVLIFGLMLIEKQFGTLYGMLNIGTQVISAFAPIVVICIGISIAIKSLFK